jgi:hypothetical protein
LDPVSALGVDETPFLAAAPTHPTEFAAGITDLTPARPAPLLELKRGRCGAVLADWLTEHDQQWKQRIATASLDPFLLWRRHLKRTGPRLDVHPTTVRHRIAPAQAVRGIDVRGVENRSCSDRYSSARDGGRRCRALGRSGVARTSLSWGSRRRTL